MRSMLSFTSFCLQTGRTGRHDSFFTFCIIFFPHFFQAGPLWGSLGCKACHAEWPGGWKSFATSQRLTSMPSWKFKGTSWTKLSQPYNIANVGGGHSLGVKKYYSCLFTRIRPITTITTMMINDNNNNKYSSRQSMESHREAVNLFNFSGWFPESSLSRSTSRPCSFVPGMLPRNPGMAGRPGKSWKITDMKRRSCWWGLEKWSWSCPCLYSLKSACTGWFCFIFLRWQKDAKKFKNVSNPK